jgi:hypothetical protein
MLSLAAMAMVAVLAADFYQEAPTPAATAKPAAASSAKNSPDDKIVCRSTDTTGSRLEVRKECHTIAEWRDITQQSRDSVDDLQRRHLTTGAVGGGGG